MKVLWLAKVAACHAVLPPVQHLKLLHAVATCRSNAISVAVSTISQQAVWNRRPSTSYESSVDEMFGDEISSKWAALAFANTDSKN